MTAASGPADAPQAGSSDHALAGRLAREAGKLLVELRAELERSGTDPRARGDLADRRSHVWLVDELARHAPGDAVLSEEGRDDLTRLAAERVWIIDPVDGTREYSEPGRTDWAVHVALAVCGRAVAGAVALPARGITLTTDPPPPARPTYDGAPRILVSRTRPPIQARAIEAALGGVLVPMGSAGAKAMAVVLGEADVYAHAGGQYEWDNAAPAAVARAAGLHVSRLDGSDLEYNQRDAWLPDLLICRPDLAGAVMAVV